MPAPQDLVERIRLRLDESLVGIGEQVSDLPPPELADLVNQLTLAEAAAVVSMLPVPRTIEIFDEPTLSRRAAILEEIDPARVAQILEGLSADERTAIVRQMREHGRRRLVPKITSHTGRITAKLHPIVRSKGGRACSIAWCSRW